MADVAQLVEPRIVIPVVVGSKPIVRPTLISKGRILSPLGNPTVCSALRGTFVVVLSLGTLAQLVEQETLNLLVQGSNP